MSTTSVRIEPKDAGVQIAVGGLISEASDFSEVLQHQGKPVAFDLAEVNRVNSGGIKRWVEMITTLKGGGGPIQLLRCSVPIVQQLNMIPAFRGGGLVQSIFVPYQCPSCPDPQVKLMNVEPGLAQKLEGSVPCPTCGRRMEFDDLPESYLGFMKG